MSFVTVIDQELLTVSDELFAGIVLAFIPIKKMLLYICADIS